MYTLTLIHTHIYLCEGHFVHINSTEKNKNKKKKKKMHDIIDKKTIFVEFLK